VVGRYRCGQHEHDVTPVNVGTDRTGSLSALDQATDFPAEPADVAVEGQVLRSGQRGMQAAVLAEPLPWRECTKLVT
jgi:hypothetical protein